MHKYIKLFIGVAILFTLACNEASTDTARTDGFSTKPLTPVDSLEHAVMEGHDVGMAKMGRIRKYLGQVQQQLDSLQKLPASPQNEQYRQALTSLQQDLQKADNGMHHWMEEYVIDSAKDNPALRIQYLQAEKEKVTIVKDQILNSLQRADSLLKPR